LWSSGHNAIEACRASQDADIGSREGIRFPQGPQGNILSGPLADPVDRAELSDAFFNRTPWLEESWIRDRSPGKRFHGRPS
jgi:hypothetical protein